MWGWLHQTRSNQHTILLLSSQQLHSKGVRRLARQQWYTIVLVLTPRQLYSSFIQQLHRTACPLTPMQDFEHVSSPMQDLTDCLPEGVNLQRRIPFGMKDSGAWQFFPVSSFFNFFQAKLFQFSPPSCSSRTMENVEQ